MRNRPPLDVSGGERNSLPGSVQVRQQIVTHHPHALVQRLARLMRRRLGEAPKQRHIDGRVELRDCFARDTKPFGRLVGTAAVKPLGNLEPIAEMQRVFVEAEMLQHEAQRAGGRVLAVEMMVVEVGLRRVVAATDVDDGYRSVIEVVVGGVSPEHRGPVLGYEYADGQ